jgi:hypothetical protein
MGLCLYPVSPTVTERRIVLMCLVEAPVDQYVGCCARYCALDCGWYLQVPFVAPGIAGRHVSYWRLTTPEGIRFGERAWLDVFVQTDSGTPMPWLLTGASMSCVINGCRAATSPIACMPAHACHAWLGCPCAQAPLPLLLLLPLLRRKRLALVTSLW